MEPIERCVSLEEDQILTEVQNEYSSARPKPLSHSKENEFSSSDNVKPKVSEMSNASYTVQKALIDNDYNSKVVICDKESQNIYTETLPADGVDFIELNKLRNERKTKKDTRSFEPNSVMTDNVIHDKNKALELNLGREPEPGEKYDMVTNIQNVNPVTFVINKVHSGVVVTAEDWMSKKTYTECSLECTESNCNARNHNIDSDYSDPDSAETEIDVDISDTVNSDLLDKAALRKFGISECFVSVKDIGKILLEIVGSTNNVIDSDCKATDQDSNVINKNGRRTCTDVNTVSSKSERLKKSKLLSNRVKTRTKLRHKVLTDDGSSMANKKGRRTCTYRNIFSSKSCWLKKNKRLSNIVKNIKKFSLSKSPTNEDSNKVENIDCTDARTETNADRMVQRKKHNKNIISESELEMSCQTLELQKRQEKRHSNRYICPVCLETFEDRTSLQNHTRIHSRYHTSQQFYCVICQKSFVDKADMKRHLHVHKGEKDWVSKTSGNNVTPSNKRCSPEYICTVCFENFNNRTSLQNHQVKKHDSKIFHCDDCTLWFPTNQAFDKHNQIHSKDRPYKCGICSNSFKNSKCLNLHLKVHGEKKFLCNVCGKAFIKKSQLEAHERSHTNIRPYKCTDCDKAYKYYGQLRIHRRYHTGERFCCEICQKSFVEKGKLKRHLRVHKGEKDCDSNASCSTVMPSNSRKNPYCSPEYDCIVCFETFNDRNSLQNHQVNAHNSKIFHCDDCSLWFLTNQDFDKHNQIHSNARPYKCSRCSKKFATSRSLIYHLKVHGEKTFLCDVCGKTFIKKTYLEAHENIHLNIRPYKCTDCNKTYRYDGQLRIHRRYHTGQRFYCDVCSKGFVDKADMKKHSVVHMTQKQGESKVALGTVKYQTPRLKHQYICTVCLENFDDRTTLESHQADVHNWKIFHCLECEIWFPTNQSFDQHNQIHSNDLPYKCSKCGKQFAASNCLQHHLKLHGEKKFACHTCGKAFVKKAHLEAHERIHSNIRPYKCTDCGKTYRYDGQLRIHRRYHTGQRFYCDICQKGFVDKADMKKHSSVHMDKKKSESKMSLGTVKHPDPRFKTKHICTVCLENFNDRTTLESHQANVHDLKIFHCLECDKWFPTIQSFDQHNQIHSNNRPYICSKCGKNFVTSNCLLLHLKIHGEKKFACRTCGKAFVKKAHLEAHERIHSNIRPYKCTDCGKTYRYDGQLRIHRRYHTGQRFYCDICQKGFVDKADMKRHHTNHSVVKDQKNVRKHVFQHSDPTKAERFMCDTCGKSFLRKNSFTKHMQVHVADQLSLN